MIKAYKPEELTPDGIPTIETQLREIEERDKEYNEKYEGDDKYKIDMLNRVKCLALNKMGKSIYTNTNYLSVKDRHKLQIIMWEYNDIPHEDIMKEFNEVVCDILDDINTTNYSKLPIYEA